MIKINYVAPVWAIKNPDVFQIPSLVKKLRKFGRIGSILLIGGVSSGRFCDQQD